MVCDSSHSSSPLSSPVAVWLVGDLEHGNSPLSLLLNPHSHCKYEDREEVTLD